MISVIIPAYNRERYIEICIRSVLSQSFQDFEIIVVDDGSKDSTGIIVDSIASQDSRIISVHQDNGGVSSARQIGIELAKGDWVCFLDSDDTIPIDALLSYSKLFDSDVQIIVSGVKGTLDVEQFLLGITDYSICPALWGKLFRTGFLKSYMPILPRKLVMGEDMIANLVVGLEARKIATISEIQYNVTLDNAQSVMKTFKKTFDYELFFFDTLYKLFMSKCNKLPYYNKLVTNVNLMKMNGFKNVVLDGNTIDIDSREWLQFVKDVTEIGNELGPSDKLFLKMSKYQRLYRMIMNVYLKYMGK